MYLMSIQKLLQHSVINLLNSCQILLFHPRYVLKEIEALYHIRKYRAMKARYYDKEDIGDFNKRLEELVKKL